MRSMSGRVIRITARMVFFVCGIVSLLNTVPYVLLRGSELPVESEWIIFAVALGLLGILSVVAAVLPRSKIAEWCNTNRDDERLFSMPLKTFALFAAISYGVALVAYFAPHTWNLNPHLMLALCPLYFVKMTIDPSPLEAFFLLAPINAAVFGALGIIVAYAWFAIRGRTSNQAARQKIMPL